MCRFIVYHGPTIALSSLVTEPEHAMLQLSFKAFCSHTPINADGFGLSWYHQDIPVPGAFRDVTPAWNNPNLKMISRAIMSPCFFAHVRAASAGGVNYPNCHPFTYKNLSFMHNGTVPYYKQVKRSMVSRISERAYQLIQGTTDSEMMFAMFITNFEKLASLCVDNINSYHQDPGNSIDDAYEYARKKEDMTPYLVSALKATLRQAHRLVLEYEYKSGVQPRPEGSKEQELDSEEGTSPLPPTNAIGRLNLAVTDGLSTCTARYVSSAPDTAHSLYYSMGSKYECTRGNGPKVLERQSSYSVVPLSQVLPSGLPNPSAPHASTTAMPTPNATKSPTARPALSAQSTPISPIARPTLSAPSTPNASVATSAPTTPVITALTPDTVSTPQPLIQRPLSKRERVVIVSSEPLAVGYNCQEVPVNYMVVSGPNAYFNIESCL